MQIEIYDGFTYQLTKYQNYLLSNLLDLKNYFDSKTLEVTNYSNQFQSIYESHKLYLDQKQYVYYKKFIKYNPPPIVFDFIDLLDIPDMYKQSFIEEFTFCFFTYDYKKLLDYHPLVRFEIICDLYDGFYLDMYNTYNRYINYLNTYGTSHDRTYVYKRKLEFLLEKRTSLYKELVQEIGKIEDIIEELYQFKNNMEKEIFNLEYKYYSTLNKLYENDERFHKLIDYNLLLDEEFFNKLKDKYEKLQIKSLNLYHFNHNNFLDYKKRFDNIHRLIIIVESMIRSILSS